MKIFLSLFLSSMALAQSSEPVLPSCRVLSTIDSSVTPTGAKQLNANQARKCLLVVNKGTQIIYATLDAAQGSAGQGVLIPAGGNWEPTVAPTNAVYLISASGTQPYVILEGQ